MTTFGEKIIAQIKDRDIEPDPRWKFVLRRWFVGAVCATSVIIGSVAVSVILALAKNTDWSIYRQAKILPGQILLLSVPYLWVTVLFFFLWMAYYNWRHTRHGYRYRVIIVLGVSVVFSVSLGSILFAGGMGEKIDRALDRRVPAYNRMMFHRQMMWSQPSHGLIAGEITRIFSENTFELRDFQGRKWNISGENVVWRSRATAIVGEKVKVIGRQSRENVFIAEEVRPWIGKGMMGSNRGRMDALK